jgi:hypothetical protein
VNERKKSCHGVRRGRGLRRLHREPDDGDVWLDRSKDAGALHRSGQSGEARNQRHDKIVSFDESQSLGNGVALPDANRAGTSHANK